MVWNILKDPWSLDPGNWEYFITSSQIDTEGIWEYCSNQGYQEYSKILGYVTQGYGNILKAGSNKDPRVFLGECSYVQRLIREHTLPPPPWAFGECFFITKGISPNAWDS